MSGWSSGRLVNVHQMGFASIPIFQPEAEGNKRRDFHSSTDTLAFQFSEGQAKRARPQRYTLFLLKAVIDSRGSFSSSKPPRSI